MDFTYRGLFFERNTRDKRGNTVHSTDKSIGLPGFTLKQIWVASHCLSTDLNMLSAQPLQL